MLIIDALIGELARFYAKYGIRMMVLKGWGVSMDYPVPNHRAFICLVNNKGRIAYYMKSRILRLTTLTIIIVYLTTRALR